MKSKTERTLLVIAGLWAAWTYLWYYWNVIQNHYLHKTLERLMSRF